MPPRQDKFVGNCVVLGSIIGLILKKTNHGKLNAEKKLQFSYNAGACPEELIFFASLTSSST
jgi:hypothetical protein